jgi:hypothetical protein
MTIGDKFTQKEFDELVSKATKKTFGVGYYVLDEDLRFEVSKEEGDTVWTLVSTLKSRIEDQDTGHANVHRPEQRNFKRYYEGKS